jgi:hypothetical protein
MVIESEVYIPELLSIDSCAIPDVHIKIDYKDFHHPLINTNFSYCTQYENDSFVIYVKGVAIYEVRQGKEIVIHPDLGTNPSDIRVYCLSNAFAAILHQRKMLPLHAGAIVKQKGISLIMGESGAGKSTLLFNLLQKGMKIFSDDVVVINPQYGFEGLKVSSSYPMMKLWDHQLSMLGIEERIKVRTGIQKYAFYFHKKFQMYSGSIAEIFMLKSSSDVDKCSYRILKGNEALVSVVKHIYRVDYMCNDELHQHIPFLAQLLNKTTCIEILRPSSVNSEIDLTSLFLELIGG